jgi:glycosyltransferase involved in cell wall biosynthesis
MGLLAKLPAPPDGKSGWPWTAETIVPCADGKRWSWPRISIVTPSYNQADFLEETIRSVLLQNYPNLEFIVCDGGSSDDSVNIVKKYAPWITKWTSGPDGGQVAALNAAFPETTGLILNWLNSDDLLLPGALFTIAELFELDPSIDLVSGARLLRSAETGTEQVIQPSLDRWPMILAGFPLMPQETTFFKRRLWTAIGRMDPSLAYAFDLVFYAAALRLSRRILFSDATVGVMHVHASQKTLQNDEESKRNKTVAHDIILANLTTPHRLLVRLCFSRMSIFADAVLRLFLYPKARRKFAIGAYDWAQDKWKLATI